MLTGRNPYSDLLADAPAPVTRYSPDQPRGDAGTSQGGQFVAADGGSGDAAKGDSKDSPKDAPKGFDKAKWTAMSMDERRTAWGKLSQEERDAQADAPHTVGARAAELLKGLPDQSSLDKIALADLAFNRVAQMNMTGMISDRSATAILEQGNRLSGALAAAGVDDALAHKMTLDAVDMLGAQSVEAMGRVLGDHGARHLEGNTRMALDALGAIPGDESPADIAYQTLAGTYHDVGYLTGPAQNFLDGDHQHWGEQYYDASVEADVAKAFGAEYADKLGNLIGTHDAAEIDWSNPQDTAFRLADNLALFHNEKLPPLLEYVPGNMGALVALGRGDTDIAATRDTMHANIDKADLPDPVKARLHSAADEVESSLPKFTLGMIGARVGKMSWDADHLQIDLVRTPKNDAINKVLDLGQRQFAKFAKTYGVDPADFNKTGKFSMSSGGSVLLEADIVTAKRMAEAFARSILASRAPGNPDALREWFNAGADGAIDWGSPGDFDQCVKIASKHMDGDQANGFCALRHQDATGMSTSEHAHKDKAAKSRSPEKEFHVTDNLTAPSRAPYGDIMGTLVMTEPVEPVGERAAKTTPPAPPADKKMVDHLTAAAPDGHAVDPEDLKDGGADEPAEDMAAKHDKMHAAKADCGHSHDGAPARQPEGVSRTVEARSLLDDYITLHGDPEGLLAAARGMLEG